MSFLSSFTLSLRRRAWLLLTPLALLFFVALAYLLENSFKHSMVAGIEARLTIQLRLLLADVESDRNQLFRVAAIQEPALNSPSGHLYAIAVNEHNQLLWQSPSVELTGMSSAALLPSDYSASLGASQFTELPSGGFRLVQTIAFDLGDFGNASAEDTNTTNLSELVHVVFVDNGRILREQIAVFRETLILSLGTALIVFVLFQFLLLRWLFRPLDALRDELKHIEAADKQAFEHSYPQEIAPLTQQLNQFISAERQQRERYRNTLSDLAHSLKTPLAAIKSSLSASPVPEKIENGIINEQLARMEQIISHQLRRSIMGGVDGQYSRAEVASVVERTVQALCKVYADKNVQLDNQILPSVIVAVAEDDLFEVLGNLLDNAFKYCDKKVRLWNKYSNTNDHILVYIENDGLVLSQAEIDGLLTRGSRLDESKPGQGLGLSVAHSIIEAYGGELMIKRLEKGGLRVTLIFPTPN